MRTGAAIGAASLAAGIVGGRAGYRAMAAVDQWARPLLRADIELIEAGQQMPVVEEQPEPKRPHPRPLWWVAGLALGAVPGVLLGLLVGWLVISVAVEPASYEIAFGLIACGGVGGVVGLGVGVFLAIGSDLLWLRVALAAEAARLRREVWLRREGLRLGLAQGRITPQAAIDQIRGDLSS